METGVITETTQQAYVDRAIAGYGRTCPHAPQPARAHSYETRLVHPAYGEQHYIVLASAAGLLAVYRLRRGRLWLMDKVPGAVRMDYQARLRRGALSPRT